MRLVYSIVASLALCPFVYAAPVDSTCFIKMDLPDDSFAAGTGTVVSCEGDYSLIMTCSHIVENGEGKITIWINEKTYDATYLTGAKVEIVQLPLGGEDIKIDGPDVAFLIVKAHLPVSNLCKHNPKVGDKVRQWGFAGGDTKNAPYYKEGKVLSIDDLFSTADARPGDSGSGLFNDKDEVVGLVNSRSRNPNSVGGFAVPIEEIHKFIRGSDKFGNFKKFKERSKE